MNNKKTKIISYLGFFFIIGLIAVIRAIYIPDGIFKTVALVALLLAAWAYATFLHKRYDIVLFDFLAKRSN